MERNIAAVNLRVYPPYQIKYWKIGKVIELNGCCEFGYQLGYFEIWESVYCVGLYFGGCMRYAME